MLAVSNTVVLDSIYQTVPELATKEAVMSAISPSAPPAPSAASRARLPGQGESEAFTVLRRMFDEGFATGDGSVVDELCAPGLIDHQFGLAGTGAEAIERAKAAIRDVHSAVPDTSFAIEDF